MSSRSTLIALPAALIVAAGLTPCFAHEDERLNEALAQDAESRARYEVALLAAQLAAAYADLGEAETAGRLLQTAREAREAIEHPYVRQAVAGDIANELAGGDFEHALRLLGGVDDTERWVKTAWKLARKTGKGSDPAPARALLAECVRRARAVEDPALRAELISGTGANYRDVDPDIGAPLVYESYGLAQGIGDPYERAIMFNEVGAHLMDIKDRDLAIEVFERVGELVDRIDDPLRQSKVLVMLGGEQAEKGLRGRAAEALEHGVDIAGGLSEGEEKADVLSELARNFGQSYRFDRGVEVAETIGDPYHRAEGFIRIAKNLRRRDQADRADGLLREVEGLATKIDDPYRRGVVLRKLASEYRDADRPDRVRGQLDDALKSLDELAEGTGK